MPMIDAEGLADLPGRLLLASFLLLLLALAGCSVVPVQTGPDAESGAAPLQADWDVGAEAVRHALSMVGVPYRYGGNTPDGFDCSGLVQYSYATAGVPLPRSVEEQRTGSRSISKSRVRPGDLLFFHLNGARNSHVGLYIGNGRFVHAPSTGKFVTTASLSNPYWSQTLAGARRVLADD